MWEGVNRNRATALVLLVLALAWVAGCKRTSDEQQLRQVIAKMQAAVEERAPARFMKHVADDFTAPAAEMQRSQLHDLLRLQLLRNERIGASLVISNIRMEGVRATVTVVATFTGSSGGWLPERGSVYRLASGWRKDDGDWKLVQASWERSL